MRLHVLPAFVIGATFCSLPSAGCSSPSRGPEKDIVEVERIELAPPAAAGVTATPAERGVAEAAAAKASADAAKEAADGAIDAAGRDEEIALPAGK